MIRAQRHFTVWDYFSLNKAYFAPLGHIFSYFLVVQVAHHTITCHKQTNMRLNIQTCHAIFDNLNEHVFTSSVRI